MRDLLLILFVVGMLPVVVFRPYIGLLLWTWISYMNPHRLTWSFAYNFRFNLLIALATIIGIFYTMRFKLNIPWKLPIVIMTIFTIWTIVTAQYAFRPEAAANQLDRFIKIQMMIFATLILVKNRRHIIALVGMIALSVGFYGLKGGIFTLTSGGKFRVMGPAQSFFMDNNTLALALIMVIPLLFFVQLQLKHRFLKLTLASMSAFSLVSILGSYSRGGFVGMATLGVTFWLKTRKKLIVLLTILILGPSLYYFMPEKWHERMDLVVRSVVETIPSSKSSEHDLIKDQAIFQSASEFDQFNNLDDPPEVLNFLNHDTEIMQDKSVSGRMDAWRLAILIANDHPFLGGGFGAFEQATFDRYTPGVYRHAAHSIFFEVIGEQGYFGFVLWLLMHGSTLMSCRWIGKHTQQHPELLWARDLSGMLVVGMFGYYTSGAFLGMAYFDLPYHMISIVVLLRVYTENYLNNQLNLASQPVKPPGKWPYRPG